MHRQTNDDQSRLFNSYANRAWQAETEREYRETTAAAAGEPGCDAGVLVVPLDASPGAACAVELAIRIAAAHRQLLVLVGLAANEAEIEFHGTVARPHGDDLADNHDGIDRCACQHGDTGLRVLRDVLLPWQRQAHAAGSRATVRVVPGDGADASLRRLIARWPQRTLVLCNPLDLAGPLQELCRRIVLQPPCTLYVTRLREPDAGSFWRRFRGST